MNRFLAFLATHAHWAWVGVLATGLAAAGLVWKIDTEWRAGQRQSLLQTDAMRSAIEIMSSTLNGNLMGSITLLGLIDKDIKQDAANGLLSIDAAISSTLAAVGSSFDADGVFVVANNGIVKTSWDKSGKSSTGLDVKFRPYFQMAMQGKVNVYAAVSMARGDRALYFTAPVYGERAKAVTGSGALVARTTLDRVDALLKGRFHAAALLSPQGVVFASNRPEWIGRLEGEATARRLKSIRDLKQFGALFDQKAPERLAVSIAQGMQVVDGVRYVVATADVDWNDPDGKWKLLVMEDLSQSVPLYSTALRAALSAILVWLMSWMLIHLIKGRFAQALAAEKLQSFAQAQERQLAFRTQLGESLVRLQQSADVESLCATFLTDAHVLFGALQGVVYAREVEDLGGVFSLKASFACDAPPPAVLREGDGLLGQCAREGQMRVSAMQPDGGWSIRSGLGHAAPGTLVMAPIVRNDIVMGLVELALFSAPESFPKDSFDELTRLLALNLQILQRAQQTRDMLANTETIRLANAAQLHLQQTLIDTIPYPVFYKDQNARFLGFNRAYEHAFAVDRADLIGKSVLDLDYLPQEDRRNFQTEDLATIASGGTICKVMPIQFADGKVHNTVYYVVGFRNEDGAPGGLVGTFSDLDAVSRVPNGVEVSA
jgi:PAS domain-containing protein